MKKLILASILGLFFGLNLQASDEAKELFTQKCAICHLLTQPKSAAEVVAPPARGIMFHLNEAFKSEKEIINHIKEFTINPTKEKAICASVQRFGLMPSQKESITAQELDAVAKWMVANLHMDKNEHDNNQKK